MGSGRLRIKAVFSHNPGVSPLPTDHGRGQPYANISLAMKFLSNRHLSYLNLNQLFLRHKVPIVSKMLLGFLFPIFLFFFISYLVGFILVSSRKVELVSSKLKKRVLKDFNSTFQKGLQIPRIAPVLQA